VTLLPDPFLPALRLHALHDISCMQDLDDTRRFTRMLQRSAQALRPGFAIRASLSYLERGTIVYDAMSWTGGRRRDPGRKLLYPGATLDLEQSVQRLLYERCGVHAWNDIESGDVARIQLVRRCATRGMIGTALEIGRRTYFLIFATPDSMSHWPFDETDYEYVSLLATLFTRTFEMRESFARLEHHMKHDALTGLQNRVQFRTAVRNLVATGVPFVVATLNIDGFRHINEGHGHMIADELLVEIAAELDGIARSDFVARTGGDEFAIVLHGNQDGDAAISRYLERFNRPFHTGDNDGIRFLRLAASIGAARFPDHGATVEELLRHADVALAVAKDRGGQTAVIYDDAMGKILESRRSMRDELTRAIANDELRLMYQPTFDLRTLELVGAEALLRWDHPERGEQQPDAFIEFAERNDLMSSLTRWVFARVVRDIVSAQELPPGFRIYFNLSAQNLDDFQFLIDVTDAIAAHPFLADHLGMEITETIAMQNVERSLDTLALLQRLGVRIAIDDFGTGFSSLSYLKRFPADMIKIDRTFVTGLPADERDAVLTETMIRIGSSLGITMLAEGIETEAQRAWLSANGCNLGQGFLVAHPLGFATLLTRLARKKA
jgi:diguanylate cyclase (GGDEF)-like protein